jgi:hypothetical protein
VTPSVDHHPLPPANTSVFDLLRVAQARKTALLPIIRSKTGDKRRDAQGHTDLPIDSEVAESILAHAKKGMEAVYNDSAEYIYKKRAALQLWENCLFDVVSGKTWKQPSSIAKSSKRQA